MGTRMWVGIEGTEIGVAVDTDPHESKEHNLRLAIATATATFGRQGILAAAKLPSVPKSDIEAWIPPPSSLRRPVFMYLNMARIFRDMRKAHEKTEEDWMEEMDEVWSQLTPDETDFVNKV